MIVRKPFLKLHQTTLDCENRRFGARFHAELCKDVANMRFDGEFVCNEDAGDILVGKSAGDERQDLQLPGGERLECGTFGEAFRDGILFLSKFGLTSFIQ